MGQELRVRRACRKSNVSSTPEEKQREAYVGVPSQLDVDLRQLRPCHELARRAVDGLLRELQRPVVLAFVSKEIALDM